MADDIITPEAKRKYAKNLRSEAAQLYTLADQLYREAYLEENQWQIPVFKFFIWVENLTRKFFGQQQIVVDYPAKRS